MAQLAWGAYLPDVLDLNSPATRSLINVLPRGDGFGPVNSLTAFTAALPAACRGYFLAFNPSDGSINLFAGTATKLYRLDNTTLTWTDVSLGAGTYTTLATDANWSFCQYGSRVIASQKNAAMQSFVIGSSSAFANLAGSPPQAGWVAVVASFVVAGDILNNPRRIHWCGFGDPTNWTQGTSQCDSQDLPDGGRVRCVGELANLTGIILQEVGVRRMVYAPGSDLIFQIEKLRTDIGITAPYSLAIANGQAFFLSAKGFVQFGVDGSLANIGEEKVDRSMLGQHQSVAPSDVLSLAYDNGAQQLVVGAVDPRRNIYICMYKSQDGAAGLFNRGFAYHWNLQRWSPLMFSGEYIAGAASPGLTLEGLDAIAPGAQTITGAANNGSGLIRLTVGSTSGWATGDTKTISGVGGTTEANGTWTITAVDATHIDLQGSTFANAYTSGGVVGGSVDLMTSSFDDIATANLPNLSACNSSHQIGFFTGTPLEATMMTAEQQLDGRRMEINALRPVTDAPTAYVSVVKRETLHSSPTTGDEVAMDDDGNCPVLEESNLIRAKLRIPAGTLWNYAAGVEASVQPGGASRDF